MQTPSHTPAPVSLWHSIYLPDISKKPLRAALDAAHQAAGYQPYQPFPGGTGTPSQASTLLRLFIQPATEGWLRLLVGGELDRECLLATLKQLDSAAIEAWINAEGVGVALLGEGSLEAYLRPDKTAAELQQALQELAQAPATAPSSGQTTLLSGQLGAYAADSGIDATQADKIIGKTVNKLFRKMKVEDEAQAQARSLMQQQNHLVPPELRQRLARVFQCLTLPQDWDRPSFKDLAAAYQVASLLEVNEDAPLLPGDEAVLDRVEYPLDYHPAYYAR